MWVISVFVCFILNMELSGSYALPKIEYEDNEVSQYTFPFVDRAGWKARAPLQTTLLEVPVPFVVIHHTYIPAACYSRNECAQAMRAMQNFHVDDRKWWDIGYNFCVGSDGVVYEGRGWDIVGAHSLHFNTVSTGICIIGDWNATLPPTIQTDTVKSLIAAGVDRGYIRSDYNLIGHRQVRDTECPGNSLYSLIQTWPHYAKGNITTDSKVMDKNNYIITYQEVVKRPKSTDQNNETN